MPIPNIQTVSRPVLKFLSDGKPHSTGDAEGYLAEYFKLTDHERRELLPNGKQVRFRNRVSLAIAQLKQAQFVEPISRGVYQITDRGREVLNDGVAYSAERPQLDGTRLLDETCQRLRKGLAAQLLEEVRSCSPAIFKQLAFDLIAHMGYTPPRKGPAAGVRMLSDDEFVSVLKGDKLGSGAIYLHATRGNREVDSPSIQSFCESVEAAHAHKGIFITIASFSKEAQECASGQTAQRILLIDGEQLAGLMIDRNIGVAEAQRYVVKRLDAEYFREA